jgi:D-sedoheptulose 7-phosphate isomerase
MKPVDSQHASFFTGYARRLQNVLAEADWGPSVRLAEELRACWQEGRQVFLCGNGGSAGNAIHLANDFLYGIAKGQGAGMRVHALPANASVLTCLANDVGYDSIFSMQLAAQAQKGDSPNILRALEQARALGMRSYAILGYSGGKAKSLADVPIHFAVDDMQISEDLQLVVGHMVMQWLLVNPPAPRK